MPSYWDRLARTYTQIGEAPFWLKHRLRTTEGLEGRVLEACCGGGQLVVDLLHREVDAYGIDLSPKMVTLAQEKLIEAGFAPERVSRADVTRLPFAVNTFDAVLSTGALGLFPPALQRAALQELARVARAEVRLLEPFEKRKGLYWGRVLAFMFDGMRPIPGECVREAGLDYQVEEDVLWGAFSYVRCPK